MDSDQIKFLLALLITYFFFRNSQWGNKTSKEEQEVAFFLSKVIFYPLAGIFIVSILWGGFISQPIFWAIVFWAIVALWVRR